MNLTARSHFIAVVVVVVGILGEWGPAWLQGLWRYLAAACVLLLLFEGMDARFRQFTFSRQLPANVGLGVSTVGQLHLTNEETHPLALHMLDEPPAEVDAPFQVLSWDVAPNQVQTKTFRFTPVQLGTAAWCRVHTRLLGKYGLAWWSRKIDFHSDTQVIPDRLHGAERRRAGSTDLGEQIRRRSGAGYELFGMRSYQPGDSIRSIDWKATARSGAPVVRLLTTEERLELVILIDAGVASGLNAGALTRLGHYSNVAARLAEKAILNGDSVHVVAFADRILAQESSLRGESGLVRLHRLLKGLKPAPVNANHLSAVLRARELARRRSLIVVLTELDDSDGAETLTRATSLLRPKHVPLVAGIADREILRMHDRRALHWLHPYEALAANEEMENWRRTRVRLERLGAMAFMALPEELDSRVLRGYERLRSQGRV